MKSSTKTYFSSDGFYSSGFLNLTPREAFAEVHSNAIIVDVREEYLIGFKLFDVPNIIYLPNSQLESRFHELPLDKPLIIADSVGLRSKEAMLFLANKGYLSIANLSGGIVDWERDGLPLVIDVKEKLDGSCACQLKPRNRIKKQL